MPALAVSSHGSADNTAQLWHPRTGKRVAVLDEHEEDVTSAKFSPNGRLVLTASVDGDARTWNAANGAHVKLFRLHVATVSEASFSADGRWIVTAGPSAAAKTACS